MQGRYVEAQQLVASLKGIERQVLARVVEGYSLIRISGEFDISLEDAVRLKTSLMTKLGAATTADLVRVGLYGRGNENR